MKKMVFYILAFILFSEVVVAEKNNKDSLPLIVIKNVELIALINNFIDFEKKHDCYHPNAIYVINVEMQSDNQINFTLFNSGTKKYKVYAVENYCFIENNHIFYVSFDQLPNSWYEKTGVNQAVKLDDKKERIFYINEPIFTAWYFRYENGSFFIDDKRKCKNIPSEID